LPPVSTTPTPVAIPAPLSSTDGVFFLFFSIPHLLSVLICIFPFPFTFPFPPSFSHPSLPLSLLPLFPLLLANFKRLSQDTLIKKKIKFSSYIRKFRMEKLQSHICLTASSNMRTYLAISSYIRKPFLIYDFATAPPLL
jgi:hypothetical protein